MLRVLQKKLFRILIATFGVLDKFAAWIFRRIRFSMNCHLAEVYSFADCLTYLRYNIKTIVAATCS